MYEPSKSDCDPLKLLNRNIWAWKIILGRFLGKVEICQELTWGSLKLHHH